MLRVGLAIVIVAQLAAFIALVAADDNSHIVVLVPPVIVTTPPVAPPPPPPPVPAVATIGPPACPAPVHDAPHVAKIDTSGAIIETIDHVRPSLTNPGWIAAWNDTQIYASSDGGATFERVLDGPGNVADVGFDCFGHVIAVRDATVGVHADRDETWRGVPGIAANRDVHALVFDGGPDVVVLGVAPDRGTNWVSRIAVSADRGLTWRYRDVADAYEAARAHGRQLADGSIRIGIATADCDHDDLVWAGSPRGKPFDREQLTLEEATPFGIYGDIAIDDNRWARIGGDWHAITGLPDDAPAEPIEAPSPTVVVHTTAYRIANGKASALPWCVDGTSPTVDPAGRVWMIDGQGELQIAKRGSCRRE